MQADDLPRQILMNALKVKFDGFEPTRQQGCFMKSSRSITLDANGCLNAPDGWKSLPEKKGFTRSENGFRRRPLRLDKLNPVSLNLSAAMIRNMEE
jgi:hypothetical protein